MSTKKIILDLCGNTGAWSKPYAEKGYDVRNITLPDYDVRTYQPPENVYGVLAAPPCDQFSIAKKTGKPRDLKKGMEIAVACLKIIWECQYSLRSPYANITTLKFWALENPDGLLKRFLGKPAFIFDPCDFGDPYTKKTHLWGYFEIPQKNQFLPFRPHSFEKHQDNLIGRNRVERRSKTPSGFARAFFEANP